MNGPFTGNSDADAQISAMLNPPRAAFGHGSLSRVAGRLAPTQADLAQALGRADQELALRRSAIALRSSSLRVQEASIALSQAPTSVSRRGSR